MAPDQSAIRREVISAFKLNGLQLQSECTKYLVGLLAPLNVVERLGAIDKVVDAVQKQHLKSNRVDKALLEQVLEEFQTNADEDSSKVFNVIDAFDMPKFSYSVDKKKFLPLNRHIFLHDSAQAKAELFRERYTILHQRTVRHELFTPAVPGAQASAEVCKFQLKPVDYLLGSGGDSGTLEDVIVLGMLSQLKEHTFYLEDPSGAVPLDLSGTTFHTGLFTEGCFVLAEGVFEDGVLRVSALGFPPPEPSRVTRAYFGTGVNMFGGPFAHSVKASASLRRHLDSEDAQDSMVVILSDVWLDNPQVLEKLNILFTGYSSSPPVCFIFCGNFTSQAYGVDRLNKLKQGFSALGKMIAGHGELLAAGSRFVFVPGPQDVGPGRVLPRPPLPRLVQTCFTAHLPQGAGGEGGSVFFGSNPCRVQYCTEELVVFREDTVTKMCRQSLHFPADANHIPEYFAKTIVAQGHLSPLPLHVSPVYWAHDSALRVYPLPDVIVCADKYDAFSSSLADVTVINPGNFSTNNFSFKVYMPAQRKVEDSRINL